MELLIKRRKEEDGTHQFNDFLSILMNEENNFTDEEIALDVQDLLAAGHETTSNSLAFSLYLLAQNPQVQEKLQKESDQISSDMNYDEANKLKVAEAVVKETLRIFPVIPFILRTSTEDTQIKIAGSTVTMPKGSNLIFSMYSLGADPTYWNNPTAFDITRWEKRDEKSEEKTESGAWLPFGLGWRNCVGARMAMLEAKMILSLIFKKYSVRIDSGCKTLELESLISLRPKNARLLFYKRTNV